jgi:hypothetical protein
MDESQFQKYQAQGIDPAFLFYRAQAMHRVRQDKKTRSASSTGWFADGRQGRNPKNVKIGEIAKSIKYQELNTH